MDRRCADAGAADVGVQGEDLAPLGEAVVAAIAILAGIAEFTGYSIRDFFSSDVHQPTQDDGPQDKSKSPQSTITEKKEFYSAIWEIGSSPDAVEGPLCKQCLLLMEPHWKNTGRYSRGLPFITHFVCERCGATTENHSKVYYNPLEIKERIYELHRTDKRRAVVELEDPLQE